MEMFIDEVWEVQSYETPGIRKIDGKAQTNVTVKKLHAFPG